MLSATEFSLGKCHVLGIIKYDLIELTAFGQLLKYFLAILGGCSIDHAFVFGSGHQQPGNFDFGKRL